MPKHNKRITRSQSPIAVINQIVYDFKSRSTYNTDEKSNTPEKRRYRRTSRRYARMANSNNKTHLRFSLDDDRFSQIINDIHHGLKVKHVQMAQFNKSHYDAQLELIKLDQFSNVSLYHGQALDCFTKPFKMHSIDLDAMGTFEGNKSKQISTDDGPRTEEVSMDAVLQMICCNNDVDQFSIIMNNSDDRGQTGRLITPEETNKKIEKIFEEFGWYIVRSEIWEKAYGNQRMRPRAYFVRRIKVIDLTKDDSIVI